ncbi:hypothetical protein KUL49_16340 [Alteromonas sp. KUL49]|nr:hypothetical protein KUL49_16340 [Alteromonas sp. KUL49]
MSDDNQASTAASGGCPFSHSQGVGEFADAFATVRSQQGTMDIDDQNDPVKMVLGLKSVRKAAHNWKTFQSGAIPGRIVVPSEVAIRTIRQLPFELDPPMHGDFRALLEPWFKRPLEPAYQDKLITTIHRLLDNVQNKEVDAVSDIALVLQSQALTTLLNVPFAESDTWISWGTHVFRSEDNPLDADKANILYDYLDEQINRARKTPSDDVYSLLCSAEVAGKKLTHDEIKGIMVLTFAGGRDTVINMLTNTLAYFADYPNTLALLRDKPEFITSAVEELVRYFSPLTHMGRVATQATEVEGQAVDQDSRISLCWASANRDERVFENPNEVDVTRKMNPHVGFGFGIHTCLGAHHARTLLRLWIQALIERIDMISVGDFEENVEVWAGESDTVERKVGFHALNLTLKSIADKQ